MELQMNRNMQNAAFAMPKVYFWMFMGLLASGIVAYATFSFPSMLRAVFSNSVFFFGLLILEVALVWIISSQAMKLPYTLAAMLFLFYSLLTGLTLSVIFLVYETSSIVSIFFVTAGIFAAMGIYGYITKKDLSSLGVILIFTLIGVIIASLINIFLQNSMLDIILSILGVVIFMGLTAYDTQKIKNMMEGLGSDEEAYKRASILGALSLYLDFINLFLNLLRLFGRRK